MDSTYRFSARLKTFVICASTVFALSPGIAQADEEAQPLEVIVLSTLHQLHGEVEGYSYRDLSALIEHFDPDLLAVELTAADLQSRRDQPVKQEYQEAVFPLLDRHDYAVIPLEPAQPLYDEIVSLIRSAQTDLRTNEPQMAEAFGIYSESLYEMLREGWTSPKAVNSRETDRLFESKHRFQGELFGAMERDGWERWNRYFLQQILDAGKNHPGKRMLVLVGAEHSYWLRQQLDSSDVLLLDTEALLD